MFLQQNERVFLEEVLNGIGSYRNAYSDSTSSRFEDRDDVTWSLQGVIIDAAHFNKMEGTAYDATLMAMVQALEKIDPEGMAWSVRLIEKTIERMLEWKDEVKGASDQR